MADASPYSLLAQLDGVKAGGNPPIHLWHPDVVKDIDLTIRADGTWFYLGTAITRPRLVRLFSTVLRFDDDGYSLVTPVERCRIEVEDVPFQAILLNVVGTGSSQRLTFTTDMAAEVTADATHPVRMVFDEASGEPRPYVMVRDGLEARINRSVYYQMIELGETVNQMFGVWSSGTFFAFMRADQMV